MTSENFVYTKVYECGPKKWNTLKIDSFDLYKFYLINIDQYNNVVILNNQKQFKSFEKSVTSQLYHQNGGEQTLTFSKNDTGYIFNLIQKEFRPKFNGGYHVQTLIFDEINLTYQTRGSRQNNKKQTIETFTSTMGFCIKVNLKTK